MDLNGDGTLEIVAQTFGAGCFVYTVPDSAENLLLWPTGRGNYLRDDRPRHRAIPGDLDADGDVDPADAVYALQVLAGMRPPLAGTAGGVNGDGHIGMAEAIYALQKAAGLR